ncbi:hypothetical protein, partial [Rhizobium leguminosarum]|uniref:hypothetical protein n=1 Tax=Rhizobium leguminosarum TaxID=384 RepID=UPI003F9A1819
PTMTIVQRNAIVTPATGLIIFQTDGGAGFYYNSGTPATPAWTVIGGSSGWQLTGNSGINPATQFIGTTDNQPLVFKIKNVESGLL